MGSSLTRGSNYNQGSTRWTTGSNLTRENMLTTGSRWSRENRWTKGSSWTRESSWTRKSSGTRDRRWTRGSSLTGGSSRSRAQGISLVYTPVPLYSVYKPLYQARESSLVPLRRLTVNFLQKT